MLTRIKAKGMETPPNKPASSPGILFSDLSTQELRRQEAEDRAFFAALWDWAHEDERNDYERTTK